MSNPFRYFNSSPEVIRLVVMMYVGVVTLSTQRREAVFVTRNFKQRRLPRTTRSSPRREACDVFGLKSDGVGR
jgi:hypothetical protein